MNILVTGGAGFVGSHFVRTLLGAGFPGIPDPAVTVLDKLTYSGSRANLAPVAGAPRLRLVEGDICDAALVGALLPGHDAVVHFAAETHVDRSIDDGPAFARTNVVGTQVLLDAAVRHRIPRFVHVSTDEVYGSVDTGSCDETRPVRPTSPYAATKAGSDLLALACHRTHGLDVTITRGSNTYGPYQFPEKIIPRFVTRLLDGGTVPLYGDGAHVRDWLHVDDHCRGVALVLARGRAGEIYNLGGGTELTNRQLTARLLAACGAGWERVEYVADRKGHDRRYAVDTTKISTELGFRPRVPFDVGLAETVAWYRAHPTWWGPLRRRDAAPPGGRAAP
ncbi:MAG TPA: dTDP-glucose 4,6-dehydratase [Pilimelia sp.]|nr:dTDP-glucose 4,6-dehydratase [Pilimelia sp.]